MGQIAEVTRKTKDGRVVKLMSPRALDGQEVLETMREVIRQSQYLLITPQEFTLTIEQESEFLQRHFEHPDKVIIIARVDDKVVGMLDFSAGTRKKIQHQGEFGMSLHSDYHGLGIGYMMLESLIEWGKSHPTIELLRLRVHAQNIVAQNLYKKAQFVIEGCEIKAIKHGPNHYDDVLFMSRFVKSV